MMLCETIHDDEWIRTAEAKGKEKMSKVMMHKMK